MPATTRVHAVKVAIVDGLALRAGLSGVQIASAFLGDSTDAKESIQLIGDDRIEGDWAQIGKFSRDEKITLTGMIKVELGGADEAIIRTTRERAVALMAEVESFIVADPSVGAVVKQCKVRPRELAEGFGPDGTRWALLAFEIEAFTRLQAN